MVKKTLSQEPGIDVHQSDAATGRIIVTIEGESTDEDAARLKAVQEIPGVLSASLIHYHFEDDAVDSETIEPMTELDDEQEASSYYQRIKSI